MIILLSIPLIKGQCGHDGENFIDQCLAIQENQSWYKKISILMINKYNQLYYELIKLFETNLIHKHL